MNNNSTPEIIVSACLAGLNCRFDCRSKERSEVVALVQAGKAIPVCPEQMGGLSTPRDPSEQIDGRIKTNKNMDVTDSYMLGAQEALKLAKLFGIKKAILKSRSPMCGVHQVYDGTFSGKLIEGKGILSKLLHEEGFELREID